VSHTREQNGGAWVYLTAGSGIFWNAGKSLRARNKVDAALQLLQQVLAPYSLYVHGNDFFYYSAVEPDSLIAVLWLFFFKWLIEEATPT